jgi:hypothetical protein
MKIVGHTKDGYLLEATADELAKAAGFERHYELLDKLGLNGIGRSGARIDIGKIVNISKAFAALSRARNYQESLKYAARQARHVVEEIEELGAFLALAEANAEEIGQPELPRQEAQS